MKREEFIKELVKDGYSYKIEGDKIIVTHGDYVHVKGITNNVEFRNKDNVYLKGSFPIPTGVSFKNNGNVWAERLTSIPPDIEFKNSANVLLHSLESIPSSIKFENDGDVYLGEITGIWSGEWEGNIGGIDSKRLLNFMIKKEMFV